MTISLKTGFGVFSKFRSFTSQCLWRNWTTFLSRVLRVYIKKSYELNWILRFVWIKYAWKSVRKALKWLKNSKTDKTKTVLFITIHNEPCFYKRLAYKIYLKMHQNKSRKTVQHKIALLNHSVQDQDCRTSLIESIIFIYKSTRFSQDKKSHPGMLSGRFA